MRLDDFDFALPEDRIALRPAEPRDAAKLLHVRPGELFNDLRVGDLPLLFRPGDALVINDTKVIPARLSGRRMRDGFSGPAVEVTLHKRRSATTWDAFAKPARKLSEGDTIAFSGLNAKVEAKGEGGEIHLSFRVAPDEFDQALATAGVMPLPPYIASKRTPDERDLADYQTTYATKSGAVAAPTAGLHLTDQILREIEKVGVSVVRCTLHVGAGTFLPMKTERVDDHKMHAEFCELSSASAATLNRTREKGGRIVAAGTTSLRTLESAADEQGVIRALAGDTEIFIKPGYKFRAVDALLTNFHLPKSTLFMLVSAFSGLETMRAAYAHAVSNQYRFYSYGDASFLERAG